MGTKVAQKPRMPAVDSDHGVLHCEKDMVQSLDSATLAGHLVDIEDRNPRLSIPAEHPSRLLKLGRLTTMARMADRNSAGSGKKAAAHVGAPPDEVGEVQLISHRADALFRVLRNVAGASLLGGVLAGAIAGSGGTIAIGAVVLGAEEFGLLIGAVAAILGLFLIKQ